MNIIIFVLVAVLVIVNHIHLKAKDEIIEKQEELIKAYEERRKATDEIERLNEEIYKNEIAQLATKILYKNRGIEIK